MKSQLFARFDTSENRDFSKDLRQILDLTHEQRRACLEALAALRLAQTDEQREPFLVALEQRTGLERIQLGRVIGLMTFFVRQLIREECKEDTAQEWADDLLVLELIKESDVDKFVSMASALREDVLPQVEQEIRRRRSGVSPELKSWGVSVELRAVQENAYRSGTPVAEYRPTISDVVGVIAVHIGVTAGSPSEFFFEATEEELELLISEFLAAKKDLAALKSFVSGWSQGRK